MLANSPVVTTIPVTDVDRAKKFYSEVLGLQEQATPEPGGVLFVAGAGTKLFLYQRGPSTADHTLASFNVTNIETTMADLRSKGVTFEEYDMGEIKTVNGVASMGTTKAAWFKDPDGNILGLDQG